MTDDNKKTPTDDKITELSAWQKRNKEYLEKKEPVQSEDRTDHKFISPFLLAFLYFL